MREWVIAGDRGQTTKIQWARDTSWLFFPPVMDPEFGCALSFEDLAVNKMSAAADRGRIRECYDLAALDLLGAKLWVLALLGPGVWPAVEVVADGRAWPMQIRVVTPPGVMGLAVQDAAGLKILSTGSCDYSALTY